MVSPPVQDEAQKGQQTISDPSQKTEQDLETRSQVSGDAKIKEAQMDGGWRAWCSVVASFLQFAICLGGPNAFGVFQAEYSLVQFPDSSDLSIAFIGGTTLAVLVTTCLAAGRLCEIRGPRFLATIGTVITVAGLLAASWCHSVNTLISTQGVIQGIGGGCIFLSATSIVPQWFVKKRARAMGVASAGLGAGGIAWSYIYRSIIGSLGYQWALRISAFITLFIMAVSIIITRSPAASRKASKTGNWKTAFHIYKQEPWLISYWLAFFIFFFGFNTPQFYMPQYIQTQGGATPAQGAGISAVINAGVVIGRIIMGFLGDSRVGIMNVFCIGLVVSAILQAAMWLPADGNLPVSFIFALLYGATGVGAIGVAPAVLAVHLDPSKLPSIIGVFFTCEIAGFLTGPSIAGAILARAGYRAVIGYSCGAMLLGSCFAVLARFQIAKGRLFVKV